MGNRFPISAKDLVISCIPRACFLLHSFGQRGAELRDLYLLGRRLSCVCDICAFGAAQRKASFYQHAGKTRERIRKAVNPSGNAHALLRSRRAKRGRRFLLPTPSANARNGRRRQRPDSKPRKPRKPRKMNPVKKAVNNWCNRLLGVVSEGRSTRKKNLLLIKQRVIIFATPSARVRGAWYSPSLLLW